MGKKELIKEKTWEYFWQQKFKEISLFILFLGITFFSWMGLANIGWWGNLLFSKGEPFARDMGVFEAYLTYGFIGGFFLLVLFMAGFLIFILLKDWIRSNWREAEERAEEDCKRTPKNSEANK